MLERQPLLRKMLGRDPARAYFSAVALAILDVSMSSVMPAGDDAHSEPAIRGVLDKTLALSECPPELRPFMKELCEIGKMARDVVEDDTMIVVKALSEGKAAPAPRMDRVREVIRGGVGWAYDDDHEREGHNGTTNGANRDSRRRTTSTENRAVAFANRINALALSMTKLRAFRERQDTVFKVLAGVSS